VGWGGAGGGLVGDQRGGGRWDQSERQGGASELLLFALQLGVLLLLRHNPGHLPPTQCTHSMAAARPASLSTRLVATT